MKISNLLILQIHVEYPIKIIQFIHEKLIKIT